MKPQVILLFAVCSEPKHVELNFDVRWFKKEELHRGSRGKEEEDQEIEARRKGNRHRAGSEAQHRFLDLPPLFLDFLDVVLPF